jgi:ribosomal protein L37AE/L43A
MYDDAKVADRETRNRIHAEAARAAHTTAPKCSECSRRMYKDTFNGMWVCYSQGHGGYQTQEQVAQLLYVEFLEGEGFAS